jgi:predicted dehydrogenase
MTRRRFLGNTAKTTAAATVAITGLTDPAAPVERQRTPSPSDRIRVALIGCGGQGKADLGAFLRIPAIDCPAIVDVDDRHLAEGVKMVADARGKNPDGYKDFRQILERKDIDAVIVATPDHWHALASILFCQAGKDVYVEKPLATTIAEGKAMVAAARRHDRVVAVGTQQRSAVHFKNAVAYVRSGNLGKIRLVRAWAYLDWKGSIGNPADELPPPELFYDMWLGPAPQRPYNRMRVHHNFRWFWDYSGGLQTDWGAHMIDVVMWAMGESPVGVMASGGKYAFPNDLSETPDTQQAIFEFPGYTLVWEHMIGCGIGPWQREHGCEFHGENGILIVDRGGWEVYAETDRLKQPERVFRMTPTPRQASAGDFHLEHVRNFVECVRSRKIPIADVEIGHRSITAPHLANISVRMKRSIRWDPVVERIIGDPEAQTLVGREYRKPWILPSL